MRVLLAFLLVAVLPAAALASWPADPLLNLAIADRPSDQVVPKIAARADGGCYVGWFDLAAGNYDVYLQRLDAAGDEQWPHNGILISDQAQDTWITDWDLLADSEGGAVLVFADIRAGGDLDVYAYRVSAAGDMLWGADGLALSVDADFDPSPKVTETADGDFVVVWGKSPVAGDGKIMMQRIAPDGTLRFPAGGLAVAGDAGEDPGFPAAVPSGADGVIVCWVRDISSYLSPRHLRADRFDAAGASTWGGPVVVYDETALPIAYQPELLPDGAGGAVLLWHRYLGGVYNSAVQRLDADGNALWPHQGLVVSTLGGMYHIAPTFTVDEASGDTYVFWDERNTNQSQWGISGQRFDATGSRLWGASGCSFLPTGSLYLYHLRALPAAGGALLFWIDEPGGYGNDRVRGFRVDAAGNWLWGTEPLGVATLLSGKSRLPAAVAPDGTALLVWEDDRGGTVDVYGQNVRPDGSLGGNPTAAPATPVPPASLSVWPNPFNPSTALSLRLGAAGPARLSIHDAQGRLLRVLVEGPLPAGESIFRWDGRDAAGAPLPTGLYFAHLGVQGSALTHKLLLLK
jgi:hypothetical protein